MMKKVISISLGSSIRDMELDADLNAYSFHIARYGTDGDMDKFKKLILEFSDKADVITFGGIDINFTLPDRSFIFRDAEKLLKVSDICPVVDGENYRRWIEPAFFKEIFKMGIFGAAPKILFPLAIDRLWLVEAMMGCGIRDFVFGDLIYDIGFPRFAIRRYTTYLRCGKLAGPLIAKLPISWIYPVGKKAPVHKYRRQDLFDEADVIAGDFYNISRFMPDSLKDKTVISNTITQQDIKELRDRGLKCLVTLSPQMNGRTFGSNVMDGIITAFLNKRPVDISEEDYTDAVRRLGIKPEIRYADNKINSI